MKPDDQLHELPQNLRHERDALQDAGLNTWGQVRQLDEIRISRLAASGRASARNLKRVRGMAELVCDLDLAPADAALLMHAGLATVAAIAGSTPQDVVNRTGRLERQLRSGRPPVVDLAVARAGSVSRKRGKTRTDRQPRPRPSHQFQMRIVSDGGFRCAPSTPCRLGSWQQSQPCSPSALKRKRSLHF